MYTIISGSNKKGNYTEKVATHYKNLLIKKGITPTVFSMEDLPPDIINPLMYEERSPAFQQLHDELLVPTERFIFISPEYNGSITGVLKVMIDASDPDASFKGKKAALVGVAAGRAGNLRGLDHLSAILNHMGSIVLPNKLPISRINAEMDAEGALYKENTLNAIEKQIDEFIAF